MYMYILFFHSVAPYALHRKTLYIVKTLTSRDVRTMKRHQTKYNIN